MGIRLGHIAVFMQLLNMALAVKIPNSTLGDDRRQARVLIGNVASEQAVQLVSVTQELKTETPGKPRKPKDPSGSRPSRPRTTYRTDPVTKERVPDEQANAIAERSYQAELADYERALRNFREEIRIYEDRLARWKMLDAAHARNSKGKS